MNEQEQLFLKELESKLWTAADKLRASLDASQYKHAVLGLIFVKYVSDAFMLRQEELKQDFANPDHEYFLDPEGYTAEELEQEIAIELEQRDYYKEKNVFWLPTELVIQFHPPKSKHINHNQFCLHLWRNLTSEFVLPPPEFV